MASSSVTAALIHFSFASQKLSRLASSTNVSQPTHAILFDALGTLLTFEPPGPRLRVALRERLGLQVSEETAAAAMKAEIAYYRAHLHQGREATSLPTPR